MKFEVYFVGSVFWKYMLYDICILLFNDIIDIFLFLLDLV